MARLTQAQVAAAVAAQLALPPEDGKDGDRGPRGFKGDDGKDGRTVLNGKGRPRLDVGAVGDFYIDTEASAIYGPKTSVGWGKPTSLFGRPGRDGIGGGSGGGGTSGVGVSRNGGSVTSVTTIDFTGGDPITFDGDTAHVPLVAATPGGDPSFLSIAKWV